MKYRAQVFITCQFAAIHNYPTAPESHKFLREHHRHVFHVKASADVAHANRDIEFIDLKERVQNFCKETWEGKSVGMLSCEMIACVILDNFKELAVVRVSEDGENGATVWRQDEWY